MRIKDLVPGMVVNDCNPSYVGGGDGRILDLGQYD
jgi:hypothetical protein